VEVVARVIANLKAVPLQFGNLFPRHVILLVGAKRESFRNEERRAESVTLQQRPHDRVMRRHRVIEGEHGELIRHRLQRGRASRPDLQKDQAQEQTRPTVHGGNCRQQPFRSLLKYRSCCGAAVFQETPGRTRVDQSSDLREW
jgi:hypothetical protein